eukprot:501173-Amphidinium_carterae.1
MHSLLFSSLVFGGVLDAVAEAIARTSNESCVCRLGCPCSFRMAHMKELFREGKALMGNHYCNGGVMLASGAHARPESLDVSYLVLTNRSIMKMQQTGTLICTYQFSSFEENQSKNRAVGHVKMGCLIRVMGNGKKLSLIHISEPTRPRLI